jgi:hypothetical protein
MWRPLAHRISCQQKKHISSLEIGPWPNPRIGLGYQSLRQSSRQLRFAVLEPTLAKVGDDDNVPQLSIETWDQQCDECGANDVPHLSYCALSYACGDPSVTRQVLVNGYLRSVTSNLRAFLEQSALDLQSFNDDTRSTSALTKQYWVECLVSKKGEDPNGPASKTIASAIYWIDSICINQIDNVEKSHQIAHMGSIYGNATRVIAWLGPNQDQSDLAVHLLSELVHQVKLARADPTSCDHVSYKSTRPCVLSPDQHPWGKAVQQIQQSRGNQIILDREITSALRAFCDRSYWTRAWIIREVALAGDGVVTLMCGHLTLDVCDLESGLRKWSQQ